jgi:DNA-binding NarL/FixJ family response regulator
MLRILIVDDMQSMRVLVKQYLRRVENVTVVGEASDGADAIKKAKESKPDLIIMDISLSGASGIEITRQIKSMMPKIRVYLYSAYELDEYKRMELDSPADGFIQKSSLKQELLEMIKKETEVLRLAKYNS